MRRHFIPLLPLSSPTPSVFFVRVPLPLAAPHFSARVLPLPVPSHVTSTPPHTASTSPNAAVVTATNHKHGLFVCRAAHRRNRSPMRRHLSAPASHPPHPTLLACRPTRRSLPPPTTSADSLFAAPPTATAWKLSRSTGRQRWRCRWGGRDGGGDRAVEREAQVEVETERQRQMWRQGGGDRGGDRTVEMGRQRWRWRQRGGDRDVD